MYIYILYITACNLSMRELGRSSMDRGASFSKKILVSFLFGMYASIISKRERERERKRKRAIDIDEPIRWACAQTKRNKFSNLEGDERERE